MATKWEEVVSDKNKYPDDMVVKLADGSEATLGDIRPGFMKDADYRQKTALLARQRDEFEASAVNRLQALQEGEAQLRAIAAEMMRANPTATREEITDDMAGDPEVRKLRAEIAELKGTVKPIQDYLVQSNEQAKQARKRMIVNGHQQALRDIKSKDPAIDEKEVVAFAQAHLIPNLYKAYELMTMDKKIESKVKEARELAYKEGMEKGRTEALAPPALPVRTIVPQRSESAPKDLREAATKALQDPEVMGPLLTGRVG